jgi:hypothetical protein
MQILALRSKPKSGSIKKQRLASMDAQSLGGIKGDVGLLGVPREFALWLNSMWVT